jgi:hypothetical protein
MLSDYVNSQNFRIWSTDNPHAYLKAPLHPQKIGIWIAVSRRRLIGPIFFNNTINGQRCRDEGVTDRKFVVQFNPNSELILIILSIPAIPPIQINSVHFN